MEKNGAAPGSTSVLVEPQAEVAKELSQLRARFAELSADLRRSCGTESPEVRLAEGVSAAIQRLEAQLGGCVTAVFS